MTVRWNDEMLKTLERLRADGKNLYLCAEKIGVSYPTCVYQARKMGLAERMNRGRKTGEQVIAEKSQR